LVDLAPTILQAAGLRIPPVMQGESLLSLMKGSPGAVGEGTASAAPDRPAFAETVYAYRAFSWSVLRSWRTGKYLFVEAPKRELYDQSKDKQAESNLEASAKAVADTLQAQLDDFRRKTSAAGQGETALSPEQEENLRALGYLPSSGAARKPGDEALSDPKDKIEIANLLTDALFDVQEGEPKEAIPKLEKVLKLEPNTSLAYLELGRALVSLKQFETALPLLREAVKRLPENGLAHYELGRVLVEMKNWEEAAPAFEAAVARTPKSAEINFYLGVVYERTGRIPEAMKQFQTTLQLKPDHFRANLLLGRLYGMRGDARLALPHLRKAVKLQPQSPEAHQFLANVYTQLGQEANARRERAEGERLKAAGKP
jgi:tetratricopeptide (TPR) repeat protein